MNEEFVKHALRLGKTGKKWLEQIPEIIREYEKIWSFKALLPYNLTYNYVTPVIRNDGSNAVLKIGFPDDYEFQTEIDALTRFNGDGIAKILKADKKRAVILIEQVIPGIPLSNIKNDEKATKIIASIMKKLWKPLPKNNNFITISEWTKELPKYYELHKNNNGSSIPNYLVKKAIDLFKELIATSSAPVLTHGDLHHDNILLSNRDVWLAIDPKGIAAEPAYETAAMIRNPYSKLKEIKNLEEFLRKRVIVLAAELNIDASRIHKWSFAQTVLSGVWTSDDLRDSSHAVRITKALDSIRF